MICIFTQKRFNCGQARDTKTGTDYLYLELTEDNYFILKLWKKEHTLFSFSPINDQVISGESRVMEIIQYLGTKN